MPHKSRIRKSKLWQWETEGSIQKVRPGLCPGPAGALGPRPQFYLFRDLHWQRANPPNPRFCEYGTGDSRRAALTTAAARRLGSRGQSPLVGEAIKLQLVDFVV